jgi:DNA polymerase-1
LIWLLRLSAIRNIKNTKLRASKADELYQQFPISQKNVKTFNIPIYELAGYEADDVIATLVRHPKVEAIKSIIVTGDLDTLN